MSIRNYLTLYKGNCDWFDTQEKIDKFDTFIKEKQTTIINNINNMSEKIYCGNAKTIETKFGKMLKISFSKSDLQALNKAMDGKEWVNCNLKKKQTIVEGKPTHYLEIDTYTKPTDSRSQVNDSEKVDDLPF